MTDEGLKSKIFKLTTLTVLQKTDLFTRGYNNIIGQYH